MAWKKGQSGNPLGRQGEKMFADAIRLMVNEEDPVRAKRKLRCLAERIYEDAMNGEGWAMCQIADRLDGKPAQESTLTVDDKRDATDWARTELVAVLNDTRTRGNGTAAPDGRGGKPDSVH